MGNEISEGAENQGDHTVDTAKLREVLRTKPGWVENECTRCQIWAFLLLGMKLSEDDVIKIPKWLDENGPGTSTNPKSISLEDQRTILADVKRTRRYIPLFQLEETQRSVQKLLTRFCVQRETSYKQGLNELLAPFYLLKQPPLPEELVYKLFEAFVKRYVEVFLLDDDFRCLQRAFGLFDLLLHFHDPSLARHLSRNGFTPELYATPWIITLFSRQLEMDLVYRLWDVLLGVDDPNFVFFLMLVMITSKHADIMLKDEEDLPEIFQQLRVESAEELDQCVASAHCAQETTPVSFQRVLRSLPLQTLQARARKHTARRTHPPQTNGQSSADGSPHQEGSSRPRANTSAESLSSVTGGGRSPVVRRKSNSLRSPSNLWESRKTPRNMEQTASVDIMQGLGSNGGFFFCEAVGCVAIDTQELLRSLRPATPTPGSSPGTTSILQYVVLDVRLDQDFSSSGAGKLAKSYRLSQEFIKQEEQLEKWLQHFDSTSGCHICLIDSHPEFYRSLGNNFFMNIFNNNEKPSNQPYQHSMRMASLLQERGFPRVTILEGGFDSLLLELIREKGEAEPVILDHNPQQWIKSLKSRGHTEILTYLPSNYGKLGDQVSAAGRLSFSDRRCPSPSSLVVRHGSLQSTVSPVGSKTKSALRRVVSTSNYMERMSGGFKNLKLQTNPSAMLGSPSRHVRSKSTSEPVQAESPYATTNRRKVLQMLNEIDEDNQLITDQELYRMALQRAEIRGHKVAAVMLNRKLKGVECEWNFDSYCDSPTGHGGTSNRRPTTTGSRHNLNRLASKESLWTSTDDSSDPEDLEMMVNELRPNSRNRSRKALTPSPVVAPMAPGMTPPLATRKMRISSSPGLRPTPKQPEDISSVFQGDDDFPNAASVRAYRPSDTEWQAWKPDQRSLSQSSQLLSRSTSVDLDDIGLLEDVISDARDRGHTTVTRLLQERTAKAKK
mmetsp:Transcript_20050/g.26480  ORF Transcript_20050/g.26480 Transcript_20050/m.26480 type:complete len:951 (+) Transcript_20050:90-2942(+)